MACSGSSETETVTGGSTSWEEFLEHPPVTWASFRASVDREPEAPYRFVVDGDIPLHDEQALRSYYEAWLAQEYASGGGEALTVRNVLGADVLWPPGQRNDLTYCVSDAFGSRKAQVVATMDRAARSWSDRVGVQFIYRSNLDATCNAANTDVLFNVSPTTASYFAAAFFPDDVRQDRQLLITDSAFTTTSGGRDFDGILRHELGHVLGFRHEHIHITCTGETEQDSRLVTSYDVDSVMHYPQCRPSGTGGYRQTALDYAGAISLYGAARYWDPSIWTNAYGDSTGWQFYEDQWGTIRYPDLDGDGKQDVCGRGSDGIVCAVSTGTSFQGLSSWTSGYSNVGGWNLSRSYWGTIRYPDLNGDGKADVCGRSSDGIVCALSTGNSFQGLSYWTNGYSDRGGWDLSESYWGTIEYPDLNGDGKADICSRNSDGIVCALSTGSSFQGLSYWTSGFKNADGWDLSESYWGTIRYPDLNGDGKADICGRNSDGVVCALSTGSSFQGLTYWTTGYKNADGWDLSESYWGTIEYPDLNGDGKADICGRNSDGVVCALSTGSSFGTLTYWTSEFNNATGWNASESYWGTIGYPDVNGDGKADICGRFIDGVICAVSVGNMFISSRYWTGEYGDEHHWNWSESYWGTIGYPDLDGDGRADICGRSVNGMVCSP